MSKQVVIIGGGVIGLCSAYYASRRGHTVTVIDQGPPTFQGCSRGNAGMIVPSHFTPLAMPGAVAQALKWMCNPESPLYVKPSLKPELLGWGLKFWQASTRHHVNRAAPLLRDLSLASVGCYDHLVTELERPFNLVHRGLLMLCKTQHALDEEAKIAARAEQLGLPAHVLSSAETARLDPNVQFDIVGAVHFPKDCHLVPQQFLEALTHQLTAAGVEFQWNTTVIDFKTRQRSVTTVRTNNGTVDGDRVVLCGGAWSSSIAKALDLQLPLQPGKGYSLTLSNPRELPTICSILTEARVAVTPMDGTLRVGGTMEIAGLNDRINPDRVEGILKALPRYYPAFSVEDFHGIQPWMGLRPVSPDGLPYLGRPAKWSNVIVATGHAMMGLSLGPITGKLVGELLDDESPSIDLTLLHPDRYSRSER